MVTDADAKLLRKVREHEAEGTPVCYIPADGSSFVEGQGYRVAIVIAGEDGYRLTGDWPYHGKRGETMPWFWGPTLADAQRAADEQNARAGVLPEVAAMIVGRSMARGSKRGRRRK